MFGFGRSRKLLTHARDGRWTLNLGADERQLLAALGSELDTLLEARPDDPSLRRLHPTAYLEDEEREEAWQLLMGEEIRATRRVQLEALHTAAERTELDDDEVQAWMQSLNALRLVLGTRLDVSEDDPGPVDVDDPDAPAYAVYELLGYLLDRTVHALSTG